MIIASRLRSASLIGAGLLVAAAALLALVLPVSAQTPPTDPPAQPLGLTGDVAHDAVSLRWDHPGDDSISSHQILRRGADTDAPGVFYLHVNDTGSADNAYVDRDVEPDTRYVYRIKARNAGRAERPKLLLQRRYPAGATIPAAATPGHAPGPHRRRDPRRGEPALGRPR